MGSGLTFAIVVLVAGLLIAFGLILENPVVIGLGFLLIGLCAIFGTQPDWPSPRATRNTEPRA